jgi:hypothetical protein
MAEEMQGIMGLQEGQPQDMGGQIDPSKFSPVVESYAKNSPREFGRDILGGMAEADPAMTDQFIRELAAMKLPAEVIDAFQLMVDNILANPETYAEDRAEFIAEGVPEEVLPEQFDPAYFAALNLALDQLDINKEPAAPAVPAFADGGIINAKTISQELSKMGRGGDTMLAHITPEEMRMLRNRGGSGTINPDTGLPEFGFFKKIKKAVGKVFKVAVKVVKTVAKVVKKIAQSPIGKIILTAAAVYFMGPAGFNLAGGMGLTGATAMGVNTFAGSTLVNLASGQKLGQAIKGGAISGVAAGLVTYAFTPSAAAASTAPPTGAVPVVEPVPSLGTVGPDAVSATTSSYQPDVFDITQPGGAVQVSPPVSASPSLGGIQNLGGYTPTPAPINYTGPDYNILTAAPATTPAYSGAPGINFSNTTAGISPATSGGGGIMNTASNALDTTKNMLSKAYDTISPSAITQRGAVSAQQAGVDAVNNLVAKLPTATPAMQTAAYETAFKAASPGLLSTYGPIAGVGLGAAYLGGAFKPIPATPPSNIDEFNTTGKDLLARDPSTYGLTYGGGSTTYAANPYNDMYSPGQVDTTKYQGDPYANIYSRAPSSYPTARLAAGGIASLEDFPRKNGPIDGPGTGTSDSVPAMLSDGEFVFTARAVRAMGKGSRRKGAKRMYAIMKQLEAKGK